MNNMTILIVDDDQDDREMLLDAALEVNSEMVFSTASNGKEALEILDELKKSKLPDYIFLDLNMPKLNGKQFLIEIKKDLLLKHIPIAICTTSNREDDIIETKQLGANFFIIKPHKLSDLSDSIAYIICGHTILGTEKYVTTLSYPLINVASLYSPRTSLQKNSVE